MRVLIVVELPMPLAQPAFLRRTKLDHAWPPPFDVEAKFLDRCDLAIVLEARLLRVIGEQDQFRLRL